MNPDDQLPMAVIYHDPSDFPGMYVGRYHRIAAGNILVDPKPFAVAPTIEEVREAMTPGTDRQVGPSEGDDPCIVEVWM